MEPAAPPKPLDRLIDRAEIPLLWLAALAVALYLIELQGLVATGGLRTFHFAVSLIIDLLFAADLILKFAVRGRSYLRSPWFLVDLFSTLPVLTHLAQIPKAASGLRFVRMFRLFRILRSLRVLRVLHILHLTNLHAAGGLSEFEQRTQRRLDGVLTGTILAYVAFFFFVPAMTGGDRNVEFWLVLGSVIGMVVMLVVVRFQIPAVAAAQVRGLLNVALPHQVANHFLDNPDSYDRTVVGPATIVFCDINGFTKAVEKLEGDVQALKQHLERALNAIVEAHLEQDMIVDKFIGDAVMSFRGGEHVAGTPEENACRAVRAVLNGERALVELGDPIFTSIKTGGASAPDALIGTFGTARRLSYTVLGDRVNLAARLEGVSPKVGARNLFCERTRDLTAGDDAIRWRRVGRVTVTGKAEVIEVFEAFYGDEEPDFIEAFEAALVHFDARRLEEAKAAFEAVDDQRQGGDGPSRYYATYCAELLEEPLPDDWQPVLVTHK